MKVYGLTGGIGMGKSMSESILRDRGVKVVDTDAIARVIVEPGQPAPLVDGQVGVVREHLVDRVVDGVARRPRHVPREQVDEPPAPLAGLEHQAGARRPARFQVHDRADLLPALARGARCC